MRILIFADYYLPGYQAGGPIRSLFYFINQLSPQFNFKMITRDRDLRDPSPYPSIVIDQWNAGDKVSIFYSSPGLKRLYLLFRVLKNEPYDALYINSFFSPVFSLYPLFLMRFGFVRKRPVLLAPRGELARSALAIKALKKAVFKNLAKMLGLYKNLIWQASSEHERQDIQREFPRTGVILLAPEFPLPTSEQLQRPLSPHSKVKGALKLVFLSRISRVKNLDFALRVLKEVQGPVQLDIYGPIHEPQYWRDCQELMQSLPKNILVRYLGEVEQQQVLDVLSRYDLFFLPTRGENLGYAIFEALLAGCPVLISDQTPWRNLVSHGAGFDLPLKDKAAFVAALNHWSDLSDSAFQRARNGARELAVRQASSAPPLRESVELLFKAKAA